MTIQSPKSLSWRDNQPAESHVGSSDVNGRCTHFGSAGLCGPSVGKVCMNKMSQGQNVFLIELSLGLNVRVEMSLGLNCTSNI
jgi:hypothetical protein